MKKPQSYEEKFDLVLYLLYLKSKNGGGMIIPAEEFKALGFYIEPDEIEKMKVAFKNKGVGVNQGGRFGITIVGEEFVENSSFSFPGTPVLKLDFLLDEPS